MDAKQLELLKSLELLQEHDDETIPKNYWDPRDIKFFGSKSRTIPFYSHIDNDTALYFNSQLYELDRISNDPIYVILNTEGGSVDASFAIYDCIRSLESPVFILTTGLCASGGLIVLSAADYRISSPNCLFFYHQPILDGFEVQSIEQSQSTEALYRHYQQTMDDLIKTRTKISKKNWNEFFEGKTSYYFSTKKALEFGFIDDVEIPLDKKVKIRKKKDK
jgi:ATP-dependent Clp protease protease subunit